MKRHAKVLDFTLYRLRRAQQIQGNAALFDEVARAQRIQEHNREVMRRACARAAEKASADLHRRNAQERARLTNGAVRCDCIMCTGDTP